MSAQSGSTPLEVLKQMGPPYPPQSAGLGGAPTNSVDTPICAVLLVFYIVSAVFHMTTFQLNRRHGHKFVLSAVVFGFSMARISALVMRIVWANYPRNVSVAIAASVLVNAGVLLLFIVNLILAQRILRAYHPVLGWHTASSAFFKTLYALVIALLVMVIISGVYSFYTLDMHVRQQLRDIQLFAVTFLAVLAFLPIPIIASALLLPREQPIDNFGKKGSMRSKIFVVLFTAALLALGASFRAGVSFMARPIYDPAWFDSKACFYCFIFLEEILTVYTYALTRFDLRFWVPNGSSARRTYSVDAAVKTDSSPVSEEKREVMLGESEPIG